MKINVQPYRRKSGLFDSNWISSADAITPDVINSRILDNSNREMARTRGETKGAQRKKNAPHEIICVYILWLAKKRCSLIYGGGL